MSKQQRRLATTIIRDHGRKTNRFAEEGAHARTIGQPEPKAIPTSRVMRLTAEYVPFMKGNRKVDYEKVHHLL